MNITVINGTEKRGVTYRLKDIFLSKFKDKANITEYYLPKDCPSFCNGCTNCILKGESTCLDAPLGADATRCAGLTAPFDKFRQEGCVFLPVTSSGRCDILLAAEG